jgi:anti-sigma28 factor (negative regulator of flagellin synthesis)
MRRTWNSWTYYGDGDSGRGDEDSVCQENWRKRPDEQAEKEAPPKGMLEGAYEQSLEQSMSAALERAMDLSDVRNERVARVKRAIEGGDYRVASRELAQRLIRNMRGDYR